MASDNITYQCPNCGGAITFDSDVQKMKCPYCDTEIDVEDLQVKDAVLDAAPAGAGQAGGSPWDSASAGSAWQEGEQEGLRTYSCKTCGGEIVGDETMAATSCPFCGNPVVVMGQFTGDLKPDYVIPFAKKRESAVNALKKHYQGKRMLPRVFKDENHLQEVKGLYVPFWLFDADADATVQCTGENYERWEDAENSYKKTDYYAVVRGGEVSFKRVPVDGSEKMPDDLMESIEPYDFGKVKDFQTAYLSGYLADRYDIDAEQSIGRAKERIEKTAGDAFAREAWGTYDAVHLDAAEVDVKGATTSYALLPVWILNTKWGSKTYTFAMNGQTGKLVGDLPLDRPRFWAWRVGLTAVFTAALYGFFYLFWLFLM